ncbi:hypothetical protein ACOME3_009625 [Neoechinorhynchus agilis]
MDIFRLVVVIIFYYYLSQYLARIVGLLVVCNINVTELDDINNWILTEYCCLTSLKLNVYIEKNRRFEHAIFHFQFVAFGFPNAKLCLASVDRNSRTLMWFFLLLCDCGMPAKQHFS